MTDQPCGDSESARSENANPHSPEQPRSALLSIVVGPTKRPICTIYPPDVTIPFRTTTWITAYGDSFVDLDDCQ